MKKSAFYITILVTVLVMSFKPVTVKASHAAGAELIYEWISDSTYRFFFKLYRDCSGSSAPTSQVMCCYNTCTQTSFDVTMNPWNGLLPDGRSNGSSLSAGCSQYKNSCDSPGSNLKGYQEWWYSAIVTLPLQCNNWRFACWVGVRNPSNNLPQPNLYVETTFNNTGSFQGNSSPYFSIKPIPYVCINVPFTFNNGAIDPNNDSLVTEIINPLTGAACNVAPTAIGFNSTTSGPPYSIPNNPIQTNNTFTTNALTGQLSFTATQQGGSTLTTRVKEYRNGVLIGYIIRDIQVQVIPCSILPPGINVNPNTVVGGAYNSITGQISGCINTPLSFCFDVVGISPNSVYIVEDNHSKSIPAATVTYNMQLQDSVRGCFSWTPGTNDAGLKNLIIGVKDSTCAPPGIMIYYTKTIPIYIWPSTIGIGDTSICPKGPAYLGATGGGNYQWSILSGTPNSLNCTNCQNPVAAPVVTTKYLVTSTINSYCSNNFDTVVVDVLPGPQFIGQNDTITCPRNPIMLNLKPTPPLGVTYNYIWSPSTGLNNDTIEAPITSVNKDITYIVTVGSSASKCKAYDTVVVDVLDGFKIDNPDTFICEGAKVQIRGTGDSRYTYTWYTNSPASTFSNNAIINPEISQNVIDKYTYTVKASFAGCPNDSVTSVDITVEPIPTVKVDDDSKLCYGDTMKLHGIVTPAGFPFALQWSPAAALDKDNILNPIFTASAIGDNKVKLVATSPNAGCSNADSMILTVFSGNFMTLSNDTAVCPGDSIQIHMTGNGVKQFHWTPDQNISNTKGTDPTVWPVSSQVYTVYGIDTNQCSDTQMVKISVRPGAVIDLPDTIRLYPGERYNIQPGGNCLYFNWFPVVGLSNAKIANPSAQPEVNTHYTVTASTEFGCKASADINFLVMPDSYIEVPNAFVPGSSLNGKLKPVYLGNVKLNHFSIFNRWGQKVYESNDINDGWDGRFNGETQAMGTYLYIIEATTVTGKKITKQGNITLIR